jgi:hypothetical protein
MEDTESEGYVIYADNTESIIASPAHGEDADKDFKFRVGKFLAPLVPALLNPSWGFLLTI